ncbi:hypothetical protein K7640_29285 [Micromonospora sp. PLK6-60]|uniref:hypothetical protein n=1 Tax=Micromonospora sp. PLK6-60 TaxID=2873383 RepID=UPI001CA76FF9|nr:hypothetical protein [Micromonospora sp. PLK6-60]MBY8875930.1 hypothetical protein [Micromonospora sp. PLK6-60]
MTARIRQRWACAAVIFAVGYLGFRLYWAAGGRYGYSACDRRHESADAASGCGADGLASLPFRSGWGPAVLAALLVGLALALLAVTVTGDGEPTPASAAGTRGRRVVPAAAWLACGALLVAAFPMHLLFQIPAGLAGHPTDWRDVGHRLLLVAGAVLFGAAARAVAPKPRCDQPRAAAPEARPVPVRLRRWTYLAGAVPLFGWTLPHGLWFLGVPFGIPAAMLDGIRVELVTAAPVTAAAIVFAPTAGGLLTLGLAQRWGQVFPARLPGLGGRRVPRPLALVPAGVVAVSLVAYGLLSAAALVGGLLGGTTGWADLRSGWAVTATVPVFLAWGVALGMAAYGYHRLTEMSVQAQPGRRTASP